MLRLVALILFLALPGLAAASPAYVGSEACGSCHADVVAKWKGSHHALAWTEPSPETVVADFDGTSFTHDGMTADFRIDPDGSYHVKVTEKNGVTTDYRIHSVAGIAPLQQYLIETEPGRIQSFDVVWDTERGGWFHLYPDTPLPPDDGLHWTGPYKNWNGRCAVCHATGFEKNYDPMAKTFASTEAEIGVGCEACHGPGEAHLAWSKGEAVTGAGLDAYGFSMTFEEPKRTMELCAGCHSRREAYVADSPLPGTPYHDSYGLALLRPGLYHADGQMLDEVYVYGSFVQSKMFARGVSCLNCHDPHTAELVAPGNAVCTQCHSPAGNEKFPTLRKATYDGPEHHHHEPGTRGAECKSCHVPEHVYMGNDWRADHSLRVPRPDISAVTGAPDACTGCHADREAAWAAEAIEGWYPDSTHRGFHYGETFALARENPAAAADALKGLVADEATPDIARATALWFLGQSGRGDLAGELAAYLGDRDPSLRAAALAVQRMVPPQEGLPLILEALADPVRSVRQEAARLLLDAPIARLPDREASRMRAAMDEWQAALAANLDFPETHLQLAGMALVMRNVAAANAGFREAVAMDPQRADAWVMLVRIAAATEGPAAARGILAEARAVNPDDPSLAALAAQLGP